MEAPGAAELLSHPAVRQALQQAWTDSLADLPDQRLEEGGWIYRDTATGEILAWRASPGATASLVVGKFHTHPNPTSEGWEPGPSPADIAVDAIHGVPDLIRADDGVHVSGPDQRRGGLAGAPGYPA